MVEAMLNNPETISTEVPTSELTCYGIGLIGTYNIRNLAHVQYIRNLRTIYLVFNALIVNCYCLRYRCWNSKII